jgi:hypothetical protein
MNTRLVVVIAVFLALLAVRFAPLGEVPGP